MILQTMEQMALYNSANFNLVTSDVSNTTTYRTIVKNLICPSDPGAIIPLKNNRDTVNPSMGLWYVANMGNSNMDNNVPFCGGNGYCNAGCWGIDNCGANPTGGSGNPSGANMIGFLARFPFSQQIAGITDGLSNTFMVGETIPDHCQWFGPWGHNFPLSTAAIPINLLNETAPNVYYRSCGFKSRHAGGVNFLFCDGSVKFVKQTINYQTYNQLASSRGSEVLSADAY